MEGRKAQASFEYLAIFGMGLALIVIVGGIFFVYTYSAKSSLDFQQVDKIGNEIIDNSEKIYFLGTGNRITLNPVFPQGIENFTIHQINESGYNYGYLNFTLVRDGELVHVIFEPQEAYVRLECTKCYKAVSATHNVSWYNATNFHQGSKTIRIESMGTFVSVDFMTK